ARSAASSPVCHDRRSTPLRLPGRSPMAASSRSSRRSARRAAAAAVATATLAALAAGLGSAAGAAPAAGATVKVAGDTVTFTDLAGRADKVSVGFRDRSTVVVQDVVALTPGAGCTLTNPGDAKSVTCAATPLHRVV